MSGEIQSKQVYYALCQLSYHGHNARRQDSNLQPRLPKRSNSSPRFARPKLSSAAARSRTWYAARPRGYSPLLSTENRRLGSTGGI